MSGRLQIANLGHSYPSVDVYKLVAGRYTDINQPREASPVTNEKAAPARLFFFSSRRRIYCLELIPTHPRVWVYVVFFFSSLRGKLGCPFVSRSDISRGGKAFSAGIKEVWWFKTKLPVAQCCKGGCKYRGMSCGGAIRQNSIQKWSCKHCP